MPYQHDVVAVRDGTVLRAPGDMAMYLVVDEPGEHIRFRYLHMNPKMLDANGMVSGRAVHEGEVIGKVGNYFKRPGGTTYHLHFDVQVPTRQGWVFVNPYMTLVAAYERLIGGRGQVVNDMMFGAPAVVAGTTPGTAQASASPPQSEQHIDQDGASEGDEAPSAQGEQTAVAAPDAAKSAAPAAMLAAVPAAQRAMVRAQDHGKRIAEKSRRESRHSRKDKRDRKKLGSNKECKTRVVKGHRRRICDTVAAETREGTVHTRGVRPVDRRVSHKGERTQHHRRDLHKGHARSKARHGRA
jgi:hypothetical protein